MCVKVLNTFTNILHIKYRMDVSSWYSDWLRAVGWVRVPERQEIFLYSAASRPTLRPTQPPSSSGVKNDGETPPLPHTSSWHGAQLVKRRANFNGKRPHP
jgi:hypothetical protein